uniref:Uncharacterized protein MANES_12G052000 n=1 Tax=Rhizophora mucronata TaxID=61149 RepID=A0A2P2J3E1_RHIMU
MLYVFTLTAPLESLYATRACDPGIFAIVGLIAHETQPSGLEGEAIKEIERVEFVELYVK